MIDEKNISEEEVSIARKTHLASFLVYPLWIILLSKGVAFSFSIAMLIMILIPVLVLITKGRKSGFVAIHAKEAIFLNFMGALLGFGVDKIWPDADAFSRMLQVLSFTGLSVYHIGASIAGAVKSSYKKLISYPLSFFNKNLKPSDKFEDQMKELKTLQNLDKVTASVLADTLKLGKQKVTELDELNSQIKEESMKRKILDIREIIIKIFENFKKDPDDVKVSRQFLNYYLDSTVKILKKYIQLSDQKVISTELTESLKKVESVLDSLKLAYQNHYEKLIQNDIMDLDAEVKVLEQTMKLEGL